MTLQGFDIANVNGPGIIDRALGGDFIICKTTEGLGFVDGLHNEFVTRARTAGKLVGQYHFAHVANDAKAEADFFLTHANAQPGDALILDFEPYGQPVQDVMFPRWALTFLDRVHERTGAPCWIYLNDDMGQRIAANADTATLAAIQAYPLWKARYSSAPGPAMGWSSLTCWQYSESGGIDQDTFYGDAATWAALAVPAPTPQDAVHGVAAQDAKHPPTTPTIEDDMTPDQSRKLDLIYEQLVGPDAKTNTFPGWQTQRLGVDTQENLTLVDYLRRIDRQLNSALDLAGRPGGPVDNLWGHVLSIRATLASKLP